MLNYRHLYYFWVVAKEGGFARAAQRLDMAVQTISAQVRELERSLGYQLLKPLGRGVALTDAGQVAMARAEEIFQIGQLIPEEVRAAAHAPAVRLAVGMSDGLSKFAAYALLAPVLSTSALRLVCHEGEVEELLSELALHHLDVVLAGQSAPRNPNWRLYSERLVELPIAWLGTAAHVNAQSIAEFPSSLARLPVLLPTGHSALRPALERWFDMHALQPNVVGEFEDSALMAVFAAQGLGVFPASSLAVQDTSGMPGLHCLGRCPEVKEEIYAIRSRRGQHHPLVIQMIAAARVGVLSPRAVGGSSS